MKRRHRAYLKQLAFPAFFIVWALILVLWAMYLLRN